MVKGNKQSEKVRDRNVIGTLALGLPVRAWWCVEEALPCHEGPFSVRNIRHDIQTRYSDTIIRHGNQT